jgi:hypothetical protein
MGGFIWQFWLDLYCTLCTLPPLSLPLNLLPTPLKAIARGFVVLFHVGIWSPSTIYGHLNLLPSFSLLPLVSSTHTLCLFYSPDFHHLYLSWCSKGCLNVCPLWVYNPFYYSSLPLYHPPPFFNIFNTHPYILYLHILWYVILLMLYHSLFPNSIE